MSNVWDRNKSVLERSTPIQLEMLSKMDRVRVEFSEVERAVKMMEESFSSMNEIVDNAQRIARLPRDAADNEKSLVIENEKKIPRSKKEFDSAYAKWLYAMGTSRGVTRKSIVATSSGPKKEPRHLASKRKDQPPLCEVVTKKKSARRLETETDKSKKARNETVAVIAVGASTANKTESDLPAGSDAHSPEEVHADNESEAGGSTGSSITSRDGADLSIPPRGNSDDEMENELYDDILSYQSDDSQTTTTPIYDSSESYFKSLTDDRRRDLDERAKLLRGDPTLGTDDWELLQHLNMQSDQDNLYFACYKQKGITEETIQLVQAQKYDRWICNRGARNKVDPKRGQWHCTVLKCYYVDEDEPIEKCRWRYEIHQWYPEKRKWSKGYYSFDDRLFRSSEPARKSELLADWSDKVTLLKNAHFVFGPFSWEAGANEFRVAKQTWVSALPLILARNTKQGFLFWQGFSDSVLLESGCNVDEIEENKKSEDDVVRKAGHRVIPVLYDEMESPRKKSVARCFKSNNERYIICPKVWKDKPVSGRQKKGSKVGAWMDVLSPKQISERVSPKRHSKRK